MKSGYERLQPRSSISCPEHLVKRIVDPAILSTRLVLMGRAICTNLNDENYILCGTLTVCNISFMNLMSTYFSPLVTTPVYTLRYESSQAESARTKESN